METFPWEFSRFGWVGRDDCPLELSDTISRRMPLLLLRCRTWDPASLFIFASLLSEDEASDIITSSCVAVESGSFGGCCCCVSASLLSFPSEEGNIPWFITSKDMIWELQKVRLPNLNRQHNEEPDVWRKNRSLLRSGRCAQVGRLSQIRFAQKYMIISPIHLWFSFPCALLLLLLPAGRRKIIQL